MGAGLGQLDADAGGGDQQPVADRGPEDAGQERVDDADGGRGELLLQAPDPRLHLRGPDRCQRPVAEGAVEVAAQVRLDLGGGGRPVDLGGAPPLGILLDRDPPGPGVDIGAQGKVGGDLSQEPLGVGPAVKGPLALHPGIVAPAGQP